MAGDPRSFVVTGASGHLGRAMVAEFRAIGDATVVAASRGELKTYSARQGDKSSPGMDLATLEGANRLAEIVDEACQGSIAVINCVGLFPGYKSFLEVGPEDARQIMAANYTAVYLTALSLIPVLIGRDGGHIVTFTTLSRPGAFPLMAAFDCAKAALEQLTRHLANEFGGRGIRANAVALATLRTREEMRMKPKGDHDHWVRPEEVAAIVRQLLLADCPALNGSVLNCYHYSDTFYGTSYFERIKD